MTKSKLIPLAEYREYSSDEMKQRANEFYTDLRRRRTVREFSSRQVARDVIENCIRAAGTAPSGANLQPWHFAMVSDADTKSQIRAAAEEEERAFYNTRAPKEWLEALKPLGTDWRKPFLEKAPHLIAIFSQTYSLTSNGTRVKNYYVQESVGIATGMLIVALHNAGLVSLTHTPSPMGFLNDILNRPSNEKPFLLLVVGYPAKDVMVPEISKKSLAEISTFI